MEGAGNYPEPVSNTRHSRRSRSAPSERYPVAAPSHRPLIDPAREQPARSLLQDARDVFLAVVFRREDDD